MSEQWLLMVFAVLLVGVVVALVREIKLYNAKGSNRVVAPVLQASAATNSVVAEDTPTVVKTTKQEVSRPKPGHVRISGKHGRGDNREVEFAGADTIRGRVFVKFPGDPKIHRRPISQVRGA